MLQAWTICSKGMTLVQSSLKENSIIVGEKEREWTMVSNVERYRRKMRFGLGLIYYATKVVTHTTKL